MEPSVQPTAYDESRYLSHSEFAYQLLAHGITQVSFDYEDGEPEGTISNLALFDTSGADVVDQAPAALRDALLRRLEDNCLCHYHGRFIDCGVQQCLWDLTAEPTPAG